MPNKAIASCVVTYKPQSTTVSRGFTLIEILVVVTVLAIASAVSVLALRDSDQMQLERESVRLMALLEAARAQSRASGVPITWQANAQGFRFIGMPETTKESLPKTWLIPIQIGVSGRLDALQHNGQATLVLGPEPILPAQQVTLQIPNNPEITYTIASDGLQPFNIQGNIQGEGGSHAP